MAGSLEGVVCGNIGVGAVGSYMTRLQRKEQGGLLRTTAARRFL